jgi:preprotein translocase subunit SecD
MLFYRTAGILASIALISYTILTLSLFKMFGFVFTAAGIAGFIISIGMAVDANVLIFEMVKDEFRKGSKIMDAVKNGFSRA